MTLSERIEQAESALKRFAYGWSCSDECGDAHDKSMPEVTWNDMHAESDMAYKAATVLREAHQEIARLHEALVKVRAHTSYTLPYEAALQVALLAGLLASVERITDAALGGEAQTQ